MRKKKRILKHFTNWLFEEYKAPRIPVHIIYDCDTIIDRGVECDGYFGGDNGETCILVAAKKLGLTRCMFVLAHEFVHYMQQLNCRNMEEIEIVENDAYFFQKPLVGKYLNNKKNKCERIKTVFRVWDSVNYKEDEQCTSTDTEL